MEFTRPEQQDQDYTKSGFRDQMKYKKLGNAWIEGGLFQVNLLTIILLNAFEKIHNWRLSTENEEGGKFDDIIFEQPDGAVLIQAKHKKNEWKKITYEDLLSTNSKKDDFSLPKYFFSYQDVKRKFKVRNVVICTNAYIEIEEGVVNEPYSLSEESMLYFEGIGKVSYSFHNTIISNLEENIRIYRGKNLQGKNISDEIISKENIRDFLNHLQFIAGYPTVESLNQIIQKMISQSKFSKHLDCKVTYKFVHDKMIEWFKQKNGIYLNERNAKAIFCEIASKRYCQMLEEFKIFFENEIPVADSNKKILHLITQGECLLNVTRVYRALSTESALFVNPDDDITVQIGIIDCFEESRYTYLVLVCSKMLREDVKEICSRINGMLDRNDKKRVILIAPVQDKMAQQLRTLNISSYEQIDETISLADLRKDTRNKFLKKGVIFQGYDLSLGELLENENSNRIVNSEMLVKLARNERVKVGANVKLFNENLDDYYIRRSFNRNKHHIVEENMCLLNEHCGEKVVLISDCAGMGKSTVLTNIAANIKERKPNLWVIRIDINSYVKILQEIQKKGLQFVSITELLNSQEHTKFKGDFEEKLFLMPEKVVMMIDGVDEISPNYTTIVLNLVVDIMTKPNFVNVFVTTRPSMCDILERNLKVKSFALEPFSKENQIDFLCKYWRNRLGIERTDVEDRCYLYAEALVTRMPVWLNEDTRYSFAGIPLQTRMLAEIFQQEIVFDYKKLAQWEGCRDFLKSKDDMPKLPGKINLFELYKMFIDKKREIFVYDKSSSGGHIVAEKAIQEIYEKYYNYHYGLAWEIFFDSDLLECYKINREHLEDVLKIGIVQKLNGRYVFIHRTFAEYFVAECLLKKLKSERKEIKFQEYFLNYILHAKHLSVIRAFLDSFLQKELHSLPQSIFKTYRFLDLISMPQLSLGLKDSVLHILSEEGCTNILRFLFKCLDFNNITNPLCRSVAKLIMKELNVDMEDSHGQTALQEAVKHGRLDAIELLLSKGANVNHTDKRGKTPLHEAVWAHSLDIEKKLVKNGENHVNSKFENSLDIVKLLVQRGADVNIKDMGGCSPLNIVARNGNTEVAKFVVQEGADVNVKVTDGYSTLHLAVNNGNIKLVTFLIENGVNVNIKDIDGCTALHTAARNGNIEMAKFIIGKGAAVDIKNVRGFTALHIAARNGNVEMAKFIIENGAAVNIKDERGCTALHMATRNGNIEMVKFVIDNGADVNITDVDGRTALHLAARNGTSGIAKFLIEKHADVNIKDELGCTALHIAARNGNIEMTKFMLEKGAAVNIQNIRGCTALQIAARNRNTEMVNFLIKYVHVNKKDS